MLPMLLATIENDVDRALFVEIYEQYHERMEQAALRILKDTHDAEDAVQNAVIGEQHSYRDYPEQEVYPHGQDKDEYNEAAVFCGAFAEYQRERIGKQQAHRRCYHCEQQGQTERLNMNFFKDRGYV